MNFSRLNSNLASIENFYKEQSANIKLLESCSLSSEHLFPLDQCVSRLRCCFKLIDNLTKLDLTDSDSQDLAVSKINKISQSLLHARNAFNVINTNLERWPTSFIPIPAFQAFKDKIDEISSSVKELFEDQILCCTDEDSQSIFEKNWQILNELSKEPSEFRTGSYDYQAFFNLESKYRCNERNRYC